jgi:hypothetical protein
MLCRWYSQVFTRCGGEMRVEQVDAEGIPEAIAHHHSGSHIIWRDINVTRFINGVNEACDLRWLYPAHKLRW